MIQPKDSFLSNFNSLEPGVAVLLGIHWRVKGGCRGSEGVTISHGWIEITYNFNYFTAIGRRF